MKTLIHLTAGGLAALSLSLTSAAVNPACTQMSGAVELSMHSQPGCIALVGIESDL